MGMSNHQLRNCTFTFFNGTSKVIPRDMLWNDKSFLAVGVDNEGNFTIPSNTSTGLKGRWTWASND
jgi:hypothetical protein